MRLLWLTFALLGMISLANAEDFPQPERAFTSSARLLDSHHIEVTWQVDPCCYLYRDKLQFHLSGATAGTPQLPPGTIKQDPVFGLETIYRHSVRVVLPFDHATAPTLQLESIAQGCADAGICYAPVHHMASLSLAANASGSTPSPLTSPDATPPATSGGTAPEDVFSHALGSGHVLSVIAAFFVAGVLLAFTPCVFPMIPVLSGIIVGQKQHTRTGAFLLSLAYVFGMSVTYAAAGVAAALSGTLLSNVLQNAWALGGAALLFVALALSMFGLYELQLPNALQSRFSDLSNRMRGGSLLGTLLMGALSALIVGPCVAPPLAAALAWIARTGNVWLGAAGLFFLALGMGVPLLLVGLTSGSLLPRAGAWMDGVRQFFGVLMLGMAIWLIAPLLDIHVQMLLWSALLILSAVSWHALDALPVQAGGWARLWKGFAVMLLVAGIALLLGVLAGSRSLLQPLAVLQHAASASESMADGPAFITVTDAAALDARLAQARGQRVVLDFYADWCVSCKELDATTLRDPQVAQQMQHMVLLRADLTANSPQDDALRARYGVFGPPVMLVFDRSGRLLPERVVGLQPPAAVLRVLRQSGAGHV